MAGTPIASSQIATCWANKGSGSLGEMIQAVLSFVGSGAQTLENVASLAALSHCEGPAASQGAFNPWNTTYPGGQVNGTTTKSKYGDVQLPAGNSAYLGNDPGQNGGDPVKNFSNWASGVAAFLSTMDSQMFSVLEGSGGPSMFDPAAAGSGWSGDAGCIAQTGNSYLSNPADLCAALNQSVNLGGGTAQSAGGSSSGADAGGATPIGPSLSVGSWLGDLSKILGDFTSTAFWERVGIFALGIVLIVGGFAIFVESTGGSKKAAGVAAIL